MEERRVWRLQDHQPSTFLGPSSWPGSSSLWDWDFWAEQGVLEPRAHVWLLPNVCLRPSWQERCHQCHLPLTHKCQLLRSEIPGASSRNKDEKSRVWVVTHSPQWELCRGDSRAGWIWAGVTRGALLPPALLWDSPLPPPPVQKFPAGLRRQQRLPGERCRGTQGCRPHLSNHRGCDNIDPLLLSFLSTHLQGAHTEPLNNIHTQDGFAVGAHYQSSTINVGSVALGAPPAPISISVMNEEILVVNKFFDWAERKDIKKDFFCWSEANSSLRWTFQLLK